MPRVLNSSRDFGIHRRSDSQRTLRGGNRVGVNLNLEPMPGVLELSLANLLIVGCVQAGRTSLGDDRVATGPLQMDRNLCDTTNPVLACLYRYCNPRSCLDSFRVVEALVSFRRRDAVSDELDSGFFVIEVSRLTSGNTGPRTARCLLRLNPRALPIIQ